VIQEDVQLPPYYIHFQIVKFDRLKDFGQYQYFIDPVASLLKKQNWKRFYISKQTTKRTLKSGFVFHSRELGKKCHLEEVALPKAAKLKWM